MCASDSLAFARSVFEEVAYPALHADQRDLVAHRVVQLTGDPQPLLLHPSACFVFPAFLSASGPLLEHGLVRSLARTACATAAATAVHGTTATSDHPVFACGLNTR